MKYTRVALAIFCILSSVLTSFGQVAESSEALSNSFNQQAVLVDSLRPWKGGDPSSDQAASLVKLKQIAIRMLSKQDYSAAMIELLNEYRDKDAYPRQIIIRAILNKKYDKQSDINFIKDVFLVSLDFTFEDYPDRVSKVWLTPLSIHEELADRILMISGKGDVFRNPDLSLLEQNPRAWLAKYAP